MELGSRRHVGIRRRRGLPLSGWCGPRERNSGQCSGSHRSSAAGSSRRGCGPSRLMSMMVTSRSEHRRGAPGAGARAGGRPITGFINASASFVETTPAHSISQLAPSTNYGQRRRNTNSEIQYPYYERMPKVELTTIPALPVHQWLDTWEQIKARSSQHRRRPPEQFYVASIRANQLRALCDIHRRSSDREGTRKSDLGVQRRHNEERSEEIAEFVQHGFPWSALSLADRRSGKYATSKSRAGFQLRLL